MLRYLEIYKVVILSQIKNKNKIHALPVMERIVCFCKLAMVSQETVNNFFKGKEYFVFETTFANYDLA